MRQQRPEPASASRVIRRSSPPGIAVRGSRKSAGTTGIVLEDLAGAEVGRSEIALSAPFIQARSIRWRSRYRNRDARARARPRRTGRTRLSRSADGDAKDLARALGDQAGVESGARFQGLAWCLTKRVKRFLMRLRSGNRTGARSWPNPRRARRHYRRTGWGLGGRSRSCDGTSVTVRILTVGWRKPATDLSKSALASSTFREQRWQQGAVAAGLTGARGGDIRTHQARSARRQASAWDRSMGRSLRPLRRASPPGTPLARTRLRLAKVVVKGLVDGDRHIPAPTMNMKKDSMECQ